MAMNLKFLGMTGALSAIFGVCTIYGCTTDNTPATAGVGGTGSNPDGGTTTGGAAAGGAGAGGASSVATGSVCDIPFVVTAAPIIDFETYNGSDLSKWYASLANDAASGVLVGTFGYGDIKGTDATGAARTDLVKTFDMVAGYNSTYALEIADPMAMNYGGGQGLWLSACLNATKFAGISFWVRGSTPKGTAAFTLSMGDTTTATPASGKGGTCPGVAATCIHPRYDVPVTDTWTQIKVPWTSFTAGSANGVSVQPNGRNITQLQLGIDLNWDAASQPVPAAYDLVVDNWAFY